MSYRVLLAQISRHLLVQPVGSAIELCPLLDIRRCPPWKSGASQEDRDPFAINFTGQEPGTGVHQGSFAASKCTAGFEVLSLRSQDPLES